MGRRERWRRTHGMQEHGRAQENHGCWSASITIWKAEGAEMSSAQQQHDVFRVRAAARRVWQRSDALARRGTRQRGPAGRARPFGAPAAGRSRGPRSGARARARCPRLPARRRWPTASSRPRAARRASSRDRGPTRPTPVRRQLVRPATWFSWRPCACPAGGGCRGRRSAEQPARSRLRCALGVILGLSSLSQRVLPALGRCTGISLGHHGHVVAQVDLLDEDLL